MTLHALAPKMGERRQQLIRNVVKVQVPAERHRRADLGRVRQLPGKPARPVVAQAELKLAYDPHVRAGLLRRLPFGDRVGLHNNKVRREDIFQDNRAEQDAGRQVLPGVVPLFLQKRLDWLRHGRDLVLRLDLLAGVGGQHASVGRDPAARLVLLDANDDCLSVLLKFGLPALNDRSGSWLLHPFENRIENILNLGYSRVGAHLNLAAALWTGGVERERRYGKLFTAETEKWAK